VRAEAVGRDNLDAPPEDDFAEVTQFHQVVEGRLSGHKLDVEIYIALGGRLITLEGAEKS
jgi:hypothetical protein